MDAARKAVMIAQLGKIAEARQMQPTSQEVHRLAVCVEILNLCEVKDQKKRDAVLAKWQDEAVYGGSFGCNASAFAQLLGLRQEKSGDAKKPAAGL